MKPKFIQITVTPENDKYYTCIYALDEEGNVWFITLSMKDSEKWKRIATERVP